ncbi:hypothetical protein [Actinoplanes sp. NPDC049118]|uniref:hypothetical protein n=1 Tax=Actinoplanes sp. NPDC049118 TaxID=3155769 RepID=UPI0033D85932
MADEDLGDAEMLLQLNLNETNRTFMPNSTAVPLPDLNARRSRPVVAVLGYQGRVAGLAEHLPLGWSLRNPGDLIEARDAEIVVVSGATVKDVGAARAALPARTRIVALVDDAAASELVAGVLTAGADVCVRGGPPAILASHLVACRRRQQAGRPDDQRADRWNNVQNPPPRP